MSQSTLHRIILSRLPYRFGKGVIKPLPQNVMPFRESLPDADQAKFDLLFNEQKKDPAIAFALSLFLGFTGIDRFYIGDWQKGLVKLLTLGGVGVIEVIDWFLIIPSTRSKNVTIAKHIYETLTNTPRSETG